MECNSIDQNVKNVTVHTNSNITEKWHSITKPTSRQILQDLKQKKRNSVLTCLNILTARTNIKQTITTVHSGNTDLTEINIARSCKSSKKLKPI